MISWFGRSPDCYTTNGARVVRSPNGWMLMWQNGDRVRVRGPFQLLDAAMDAWVVVRERVAQP